MLPLYIAETASGFEIRKRDGEVVSTHASLRDGDDSALRALEQLDGFKRKAPRFDDGAWRWIDMTAVEPEPAADGSQVTERGIRNMAERLNAGDPIAIDGGASDSPPHGTMTATDTLATGWVHVGVEVEHEDGRLHLWGLAEVLPAVARDMDANRLALGSVMFSAPRTSDGGLDNDRAELVTHALTNVPAVAGLTPAGSPRTRSSFHCRSLEVHTMTTLATRGPAADALAAVYKLLEIDPEAHDAPWLLHDKVSQLHAAAATEAITESGETVETDAPASDETADDETESETAATRTLSMQRDIATREAENAALRDRVAELSGQIAKREREDAIDAEIAKRRVVVSPAQRAELSSIAEASGLDGAMRTLRLMHAPPSGSPIPMSLKARAAKSPEADDVARTDEETFIARAKERVPELQKKHPTEPAHYILARAMKAEAAASGRR